MTRVAATVAAFAVAALLGSADGSAVSTQNPTLFGTVGPGQFIILKDAQGSRVTKLDPGTFDIVVDDLSDEHSFDLEGPGVSRRTEIFGTGKVTWTVTFVEGNYKYFCDAHSLSMRGAFVVGNPPSTTPPPRIYTPRTRLVVTAGPAEVITLKTAAGGTVKALKRGTYTVTVRDRSPLHNVHLVAPGYNRKTTVPFVGTQTWKVKLARQGTLRYRCDVHASSGMRGSARIFA